MRILGISAHHLDAAAALVIDGEAVAAAREEQFTGQLGEAELPLHAARFCLDQTGIHADQLDHVVFHQKPLLKFERVLLQQLRHYPRSAGSFVDATFEWLGDRLWLKNNLARELGVEHQQVLFTRHQMALAANAYFSSPSEKAALLVLGEVGEWCTTWLGKAEGPRLETSMEVSFPHSLGLLVSAITQFLGFVPGRDEDVIETLAPHGTPRYLDAMRCLVPPQGAGFSVDQSAFRFGFDDQQLYADCLTDHLGAPRYCGEALLLDGDDRRHADIASSLQELLYERVLALVVELHRQNPCDDLCLAGALAGNRRLLARIVTSGPFSRVFVPATPDRSGAALGAYQTLNDGISLRAGRTDLGEAIDQRAEPGAETLSGDPVDELQRRLLRGELVAWVRGRIEFAACSLGQRLVLSLPPTRDQARRLLPSLQRSEPFLPRRLAMPAEFAEQALGSQATRFHADLLRQAQVRLMPIEPRLADLSDAPDGSIWPQRVAAEDDPQLYRLLQGIGAATGLPVLQVDDFALRGAPVVRNEAAAVAALQRSQLDCLVVEGRLYERRATQ